MNHAAILSVLFAAAALGRTMPAVGEDWNGDINVLLAGKRLDNNEWAPTQRQGELGLQTDFQPPAWPVALAVDFLAAGANTPVSYRGFTEQRARTSELDLGVRKIFRPAALVRPYVGGGLALASAELEYAGPFGTISDHDGGAGAWIGGGVFWTLASAFNIGLDAKFSSAQVNLFGQSMDAGGFHLGLLLGYHWGG